MLEQTKRISFRISSVLSKMEPEPDLYTGSDQKVTAPAGSGSATLDTGTLQFGKAGSASGSGFAKRKTAGSGPTKNYCGSTGLEKCMHVLCTMLM